MSRSPLLRSLILFLIVTSTSLAQTMRIDQGVILYSYPPLGGVQECIGVWLNFCISEQGDSLCAPYERKGPSEKKPYKNDIVTLKPGEAISERIDLSKYYKMPNTGGVNRVYGYYQFSFDKGAAKRIKFWRGKIVSDTILIKQN